MTVKRKGIFWLLDLTQGIDLSIFLFGEFELGTSAGYRRLVSALRRKHGLCIIYDVGANIGSHSLPLANECRRLDEVHAFEPTSWAIKKFNENLSLNTKLASFLTVNQTMVTTSEVKKVPEALESSWSLKEKADRLSRHGAQFKSTKGSGLTTLDEYKFNNHNSKIVSLVKIDVDGYESDVLYGAIELLKRDKPLIVIEWAPYLFDYTENSLANAYPLLADIGYTFAYKFPGLQELSCSLPDIVLKNGESINIVISTYDLQDHFNL